MENLKNKSLNKRNHVHPKENSNCLSSLFFCWVLPIFAQGLKKTFNDEDLFGPLKSHESRKLGTELLQAWTKEKALNQKPYLHKIIIKVYYKDILFYAIFLFIQEFVIKLGQPLLVGKLLEFYVPNQTAITLTDAYFYASGIIILSFCNVLLQHTSFFGLQHLAMKMQVACRALIYQKALRLSKNAVAETSVGQIVNLISNDVSRFHYICLHIHQFCIAPIQTIIVLYLLFITVDSAAMVGVGLFVIFIPFLFYLGKLSSRYRLRTAVKTDNRLRLMNEIISGVQIIKMYGWEKPFAKLVQLARKLEINQIRASSYVRTIYMSTTMFLIPTATFLSITTYVLTGNKLQAYFVYVMTSFYGSLRQPLTLHLPRCIAVLAEINVSLNRIQTFLLREEVKIETTTIVHNEETNIFLENVNAKWSHSDFGLDNISVNIGPKQLIAVTGRVGCGKTTLIHTILKEISISSGRLDVKGTISYASQEPWLFASSIKQNILFGEKFYFNKYQKVVEVCALDKDFLAFPYGDRTIVGEKGVMLSGGQKARVALARAIYKDADIYLLDDPLSAVDVVVGRKIFDECILGYLKNKCTVLVTHQLQYLNSVDQIFLMENGSILANGNFAQIKNLDGDFIKHLRESENDVTSSKEEPKTISEIKEETDITVPSENKEHRNIGKVSNKVYLHYLKIGGSFIFPIIVLTTFILTQLASTGIDYFLTFWVNLEQKRLEGITNNSTYQENIFEEFFSSNNLLYTYTALIISLLVMVALRSLCFIEFSMNTAKCLHDAMFEKIIHATMRFFHTNSSGRVINRFSRDIGIVDEYLPSTITDCIQVFLNVVAITIVVSSVNIWIIIPTIILFGLFYGYKFVFLATSRDLKRIESTARSPIFSHLAASLQGLSTIRAFGAQYILESEFDHLQDHHSSAYYMFMACSRSFGFWLDVNCVVYIGIVIFSFLIIGTEIYGGNVGLAITQSIALTGTLQRGIRQWSDLENQLTSVERIVEYTELVPESDIGRKIPPKFWPNKANISFENVSLKYSEDSPTVLKDITFNIAPKEKIGIVGRTGSGKSSLISALFRLAPIQGTIKIDNIDIMSISLNTLRSSISIIPQEPILFSGPLRKNLDPFDEYSDNELWNALEEVQLKKIISDLPSGLSSHLSESGSNLSVGERQLLCFARAIVRKNSILILDEATANVDLHTDELIQETIRKKFNECTVLTIAHRLFTIMDSDKILVLDEGVVLEFDSPRELLKDTKGVFYNLVKQSGLATTEALINVTKKKTM